MLIIFAIGGTHSHILVPMFRGFPILVCSVLLGCHIGSGTRLYQCTALGIFTIYEPLPLYRLADSPCWLPGYISMSLDIPRRLVKCDPCEPTMKVAYAGQVVEVDPEIDYDYVEMKHDETIYIPRSHHIHIPCRISVLAKNGSDGYSDSRPMGRPLSVHRTGLAIDSSDDLTTHLEELREKLLSDSAEAADDLGSGAREQAADTVTEEMHKHEERRHREYTDVESKNREYEDIKQQADHDHDNDHRLMIINYVKVVETDVQEGILQMDEFEGFRVRMGRIVRSDTYQIKEPFTVSVERQYSHGLGSLHVRIENLTECGLAVSFDGGCVVPGVNGNASGNANGSVNKRSGGQKWGDAHTKPEGNTYTYTVYGRCQQMVIRGVAKNIAIQYEIDMTQHGAP